jgi:hypothetical protein
MSAALMPHLGAEAKVQAFGQTWILARWTVSIWNDFLDWAKGKMPDPFAGLDRVAAMIPADASHAHPVGVAFNQALQRAQERAAVMLSLQSPEVSELLQDPRGAARIAWLLLRKNHPDITEDMAFAIVDEIGPEKMREAFEIAQGKLPPPVGNEQAPAA